MGLMGDSWIKDMVGYGLTIVGSYARGVFTGMLLMISRNQLARGGAISPQPVRPFKMSNHHKTQEMQSMTDMAGKRRGAIQEGPDIHIHSGSTNKTLTSRPGSGCQTRRATPSTISPTQKATPFMPVFLLRPISYFTLISLD